MTFNAKQLEALAAPLNRDSVKQREQAGRKLSYIEAWHAIAEANRIFGYDGWNRETVELKLLGEPREVPDKYGKPQYRVGYMAKVRITVGAIIREGCGFGSGIDKDVDQAHESALKEAESDAMKRALMTFGNQFGLALYDKEQANVADAPPSPSALDVAMSQLIGATSAEDFAAIWAKLKGGAPNVMSKAEYAQLVDFMKREAERWKPQQAAESAPAKPATEERSFAMSEEEIPF